MFDAKLASLTFAVAKKSWAFGATSWTICIIARPSSVPGEKSCRTVTGVVFPAGFPGPGRLPLAMSAASAPSELKLSEMTPILTPCPE